MPQAAARWSLPPHTTPGPWRPQRLPQPHEAVGAVSPTSRSAGRRPPPRPVDVPGPRVPPPHTVVWCLGARYWSHMQMHTNMHMVGAQQGRHMHQHMEQHMIPTGGTAIYATVYATVYATLYASRIVKSDIRCSIRSDMRHCNQCHIAINCMQHQ